MISNVNMRSMYNKSAADSMGSIPYSVAGLTMGEEKRIAEPAFGANRSSKIKKAIGA